MKQKAKQHPTLNAVMTARRLSAMQVIDTLELFKLLFEPKTGYYFVYNIYTTASYYSRSFNTARSFFDRYIGLLD